MGFLPFPAPSRKLRDRSFLPSAVVGLPDRKCGMVSTYLHILAYIRWALGDLAGEGPVVVRYMAALLCSMLCRDRSLSICAGCVKALP